MWQAHEYHYHFAVDPSYVIPLLGFGAGLGLFANGFWNYRRLRVIENTRQTPVREIPMGLVRVRGKVTGSSLLASPVTHTPCYYYRVLVERWDEREMKRGWRLIHKGTDRSTFYVDDGTGKVLVNPQSAEFDLPVTYCAEIGRRASSKPRLDPNLGLVSGPTEQELLDYAAKAKPVRFRVDPQTAARLEAKYAEALKRDQDPLTGHISYRITEWCLIAEHPYDLIGTCTQNPQPRDDQDRNLILKGRTEPILLISGFTEQRLEKILRKRALKKILLGGLLMAITLGLIIYMLLKR